MHAGFYGDEDAGIARCDPLPKLPVGIPLQTEQAMPTDAMMGNGLVILDFPIVATKPEIWTQIRQCQCT